MLSEHHFSQVIQEICYVLEHFIRDNFKRFMEPNIHTILINYTVEVFKS